jgi:hypothetical protein
MPVQQVRERANKIAADVAPRFTFGPAIEIAGGIVDGRNHLVSAANPANGDGQNKITNPFAEVGCSPEPREQLPAL